MKERSQSATLFHSIPKSTVANVLERLGADEMHDKVVVRGKSYSSVRIFVFQLSIAVALILATVAALFGISRSFTNDERVC